MPRRAVLVMVALLLMAASLATVGCKKQQIAPRTDQQIASDIQAKIQGESALSGQNIQVSVANGVATLSGAAADDASRALAGNDSGQVAGVKTVVNNLSVQPAQAAPTPASAPPAEQEQPRREPNRRARLAQAEPPSPPVHSAPAAPAYSVRPALEPAPAMHPAPPPQPVVRTVTLAAGTEVPVILTEALNSESASPNDVFHATLARDLMANGVVVIPRGAPVLGRVVDARNAAHFKGRSLLSLELTQASARGQRISLETSAYTQEGAARGKNTTEKAVGGALLGALIGGLAGGGKGAAVGAAAGGGAGAGINAVTRGQQVDLPSETRVQFQLQAPVTVTVTLPPPGSQQARPNYEPQLQTR